MITSTAAPAGSTPTTNTLNYPLAFGSNAGDLKKYDYGLGALAGLRLKNDILFSASYEHGLTSDTNSTSQSYKQDVISFSIGYTFL